MLTINGKACFVNGKPVDKVYSDGKQVYGRNLLAGSYDSTWDCRINNTNTTTIQKVTMDSGERALHIIATTIYSGIFLFYNPPSGDYTVSVDVKGTGKVIKLGWEAISDAGMTLTSDWQRVSRTGTLDSKGNAFTLYGTMDVYVRFLKVEKGRVATPWTPAPEDVGVVVK